jgi:predicted transcriptional regulator
MALRDIRKYRALTQEQVAKSLGGKQFYVSRLESRSDVKVSTLRDYVHALGGELQLMVTFPDGAEASIKGSRKLTSGNSPL